MLAVAVAMTVAIDNVAGWFCCHCAIAIAIAVTIAVAVTVAIAVTIPLPSHLQIHIHQLIIVQIFYFSIAATSSVACLLNVGKIFESLFLRLKITSIDDRLYFSSPGFPIFFTYFLQAGRDGLQMCK